jgi:adenylylsulfate kinase-like enzyme
VFKFPSNYFELQKPENRIFVGDKMIFWLIGPSGVGKTTIGKVLVERVRTDNKKVVHLDGDVMRAAMMSEGCEDYSVPSRLKNIQRFQKFCKILDENGISAICSTLCIFPEILELNRSVFNDYFDVELKASLDSLIRRDPKGLYFDAQNGKIENFVGINIPYPKNLGTDLAIETDTGHSVEDISNKIWEIIGDHF